MKIIKGPATSVWWAGRQSTCSACGTIIEFEADDLSRCPYIIPQGRDNEMNYVCPTCGRANSIKYGIEESKAA